ncbi:MAG TPA: M23 family metallopeptidase [Luteimonas sp.]|nr:M23 family metallopeptidase [Luteimonas sp.]
MRALLLLLVGALVGANIVYFAMSRGRHAAGEATMADATPTVIARARPATPPAEAAPPSPQAPANEPTPTAGTPATPASLSPGTPPSSAGASASAGAAPVPGPSGLLIPVRGVRADALVDTYADARSEGRSHDAIDIMAPAGTPVLAVADGHVEKLFTSDRGGLTIYQFEPGGRYAYYYAHLQSYAPGLKEKKQLKQGEVIGYVGSTGNASPQAPHLHFAIFVLGPEKRWWEGSAIDPYPLLRGGSP